MPDMMTADVSRNACLMKIIILLATLLPVMASPAERILSEAHVPDSHMSEAHVPANQLLASEDALFQDDFYDQRSINYPQEDDIISQQDVDLQVGEGLQDQDQEQDQLEDEINERANILSVIFPTKQRSSTLTKSGRMNRLRLTNKGNFRRISDQIRGIGATLSGRRLGTGINRDGNREEGIIVGPSRTPWGLQSLPPRPEADLDLMDGDDFLLAASDKLPVNQLRQLKIGGLQEYRSSGTSSDQNTLSITNNIDILRDRLLREILRRKQSRGLGGYQSSRESNGGLISIG